MTDDEITCVIKILRFAASFAACEHSAQLCCGITASLAYMVYPGDDQDPYRVNFMEACGFEQIDTTSEGKPVFNYGQQDTAKPN